MGDMPRAMNVFRSKNCLILVLFLTVTTISIWVVSMPSPNIKTIMTETHKQISNLKNMNMMNTPEKQDIKLDDTYLELLGFVNEPKLYQEQAQNDTEISLPVIVTSVRSGHGENEKALNLIKSVQKYLPDKHILLFDLGMNSYELLKLKKQCNESSTCTIKGFDFGKFPGHLKDPSIKAYKPIAIQEALNEYGAIIWTEGMDYFTTGEIVNITKSASVTGLQAWTLSSNLPTSALTHPRMFQFFKTKPDDYYFHRMVATDHLVLYNTESVHNKLMLRWVQCALAIKCIWPYGAQNVRCKKSYKPLYKYSGCHKFEASAFNVILGMMFHDDVDKYINYDVIFGEEEEVEQPEDDDKDEVDWESVSHPPGNGTLFAETNMTTVRGRVEEGQSLR